MRKLKQSITKPSKTKLHMIDLEWQRFAKIFALSSANVSKYEFLTEKDV